MQSCTVPYTQLQAHAHARRNPIIYFSLRYGMISDVTSWVFALWKVSSVRLNAFECDYISLFLFSPLSGVTCCRKLFAASSGSLFDPPLSPVFFFQSFSSPAFTTFLLRQSSRLSLDLHRLLLPCSRNSATLFVGLSSDILSTCPAHCGLLLTSVFVKLLSTTVSSLHFTILLLCVLFNLANFSALPSYVG